MWRDQLRVRLEGRLVTLEPLAAAHLDGLLAAAADERIWRFMVTTDVQVWIEQALADAGRVQFTVLRDDVPGGSTRYMSLAPEHLRLELGNTWWSPATWGAGANTEAQSLLLRRALEPLGA